MDVGTQDNPGADTPRRADRTRRVGRRRVMLAVVCLVMGVLVSVAGVVSGWRAFGYLGKRITISFGGGGLAVVAKTDELYGPQGWFLRSSGSRFSWNAGIAQLRARGAFRYDLRVGGVFASSTTITDRWGIVISLWFIAGVFVLSGTGLAFSARRSIRRARAGLCPTCRYDLRGLPAAAPCPECGMVRVARAVGVASGDEGKGGA